MKPAWLAALLLSVASAQGIPSKGFPPPSTVPGSSGFYALDKDFYAVSGTDVFTVEGGQLVRRDASTTMKAWTKDGHYAAPPIPIGQNVYLQQGGKLYAFDRVKLKRLWVKNISGELLAGVRELPLLRENGKITRLNPATGAAVWTIGKLDAEHTPLTAKLAGGVLLVGHSPAESFEGEIFSAHDPQTGRKLWQTNLGHGRLLKVAAGKAFFDLRDWDNTLDAGGVFHLAQLDLKTGARLNISFNLPELEKWSVNIGSPLLDDKNVLWLVLRAPGEGGSRLARVDAAPLNQQEPKLWPLPADWLPKTDNGEVRLFARGKDIFMAAPGGLALVRDGILSTFPIARSSGLPTFTPLGRWLGITAAGWGTVILDEESRFSLEVEKAGPPALSGPYLLMPVEGRLTLFGGPK